MAFKGLLLIIILYLKVSNNHICYFFMFTVNKSFNDKG